MARVLYITYTGLLEPLGRSQVLSYVRPLSTDHRMVLLSFERPADLSDEDRVTDLEAELDALGVGWVRLQYHKRVPPLATSRDILTGLWEGSRIIRDEGIDLVHARSYVPAAIALWLERWTGVPFIFDMRGFWADERVDGGLWRREGILHRLGKGLEKNALQSAAVIVSLTQAGVEEMCSFPYLNRGTRFEVIPTCVDTTRFQPTRGAEDEASDHGERGSITLAWVGSVDNWYHFEPAARAFKEVQHRVSQAKFLILNRGQHDVIHRSLNEEDIPSSAVEVKTVHHEQVPRELSKADAGIFFIEPAYSKKASSPTKMAEFLAMGIPCFTNSGVGDVEQILSSRDAGVVIDSLEDSSIKAGVGDLLELLNDPETPKRCRELALERFDLRAGVNAYNRIYRDLAAQGRSP